MPENNEEKKFVGSGILGGILGAGTTSTLVSAQEAKGRSRLIAAGKVPSIKRRLLWNILELGAAAAGGAGGALAERRLVHGPSVDSRGNKTMLPSRLRYHMSEVVDGGANQQKTASLPARKLLGSEFLGLLAGGNKKRLAAAADEAAAKADKLKSVQPTRQMFRETISKKRLEAAAARGKVSNEDMRIASTPSDELTEAEKLRKEELRKSYRTGFFESYRRMRDYKNKVSAAEADFKRATDLSDEEAARVSSARNNAALGAGGIGVIGAGGYIYAKKRKRDAQNYGHSNY